MKSAHRKCVVVAVMCFISLISFCGERVGDDIAAISEKINQCLSVLSDSNYGNSRYIMEFGLPDRMVERENCYDKDKKIDFVGFFLVSK